MALEGLLESLWNCRECHLCERPAASSTQSVQATGPATSSPQQELPPGGHCKTVQNGRTYSILWKSFLTSLKQILLLKILAHQKLDCLLRSCTKTTYRPGGSDLQLELVLGNGKAVSGSPPL